MTGSPVFAQPTPRHPPLSRGEKFAYALGVPFLLLLLCLQILLAERAHWAADARTRPTLEAVCRVLRCQVPIWQDPSAFTVPQREIQPHPSAAGALLVTASFRNDAAWPQAWPVIELVLTDLNGESVGLRRFQPHEYLGAAPPSGPMLPGQSASLALEIMDPGNRAVAFAFEFR